MEIPVTYESIVEQMNSMEFSGMKLGLSRIKEALGLFGHPEKGLKIVHIAGTTGKGSVAAMVSTMLSTAGHRVGMFTSPHLIDVRERIQINGELISKDDFRDVYVEASSKMAELTFFELLTLMAVLYFSRQKVDYAVFEVGLGGTYDATNFDSTFISAITKIALDHTNILGDTVEEIARDKCGIIKQGQEVVTTSSNKSVMGIIEDAVSANGAKLTVVSDSSYDTVLKGKFQRQNAGIAVEIARKLGVGEDAIKKGLRDVVWPGRIEYLADNLLVDCAHNAEGITALAEYVDGLDCENVYVVFAVGPHKDYKAMIELLHKHEKLIFTQSSVVSRRLPLDEVVDEIECEKIVDPIEAVRKAVSLAGEKDLVLVCGSIFLVADVKIAIGKGELLL